MPEVDVVLTVNGGDEHHALDDAKHQAREVSRTLARLDQGGVGTDD
jgi:hypothetical protein